jgi:hypothetical protein
MLDSLLADCRPHPLALGCPAALDHVHRLAATNGATRQRAFVASSPRLSELVVSLADRFLAPRWRAGMPGEQHGRIRLPDKGAAYVPLARILRLPDPGERRAFPGTNSLVDQSLHSRLGAESTNGDGFGAGWYGAPETPGVYRSVEPA